MFLDGKETVISYNNPEGVMEFDVVRGDHDVKVEFSETPLRLISNIISLLGFVVLIVLTIKPKTKKS